MGFFAPSTSRLRPNKIKMIAHTMPAEGLKEMGKKMFAKNQPPTTVQNSLKKEKRGNSPVAPNTRSAVGHRMLQKDAPISISCAAKNSPPVSSTKRAKPTVPLRPTS